MEITVFFPEHIEALRILYLESRKVTTESHRCGIGTQLLDFVKSTPIKFKMSG